LYPSPTSSINAGLSISPDAKVLFSPAKNILGTINNEESASCGGSVDASCTSIPTIKTSASISEVNRIPLTVLVAITAFIFSIELGSWPHQTSEDTPAHVKPQGKILYALSETELETLRGVLHLPTTHLQGA